MNANGLGMDALQFHKSPNFERTAFFPGFCIAIFLISITCYAWCYSYIDDAYIGFRCIDNFLRGEGFNFNSSERIESVTNIGWLVFLTPFSIIIKPQVAGKVFGVIFLVVSAFIITKIGVKYDRECNEGQNDFYMRYILPFLAFTSPTFLYYSQSGMETAFLCAIVGLPLLFKRSKNCFEYTAAVYGFAFSVRPECLLLFPLYVLALYLLNSHGSAEIKLNRNNVLRGILAWLATVLFISLSRYAYFGDLLPNTFYAKQTSILDFALRVGLFFSGNLTNLPLPYSGFFLLPVILLGLHQLYIKSPEAFPAYFSIAITGWFFSIYATPDWTMTPRYISPYLPYCLLVILAGLTNDRLWKIQEFISPLRIFYSVFFLIMLSSNFISGVMWFSSAAADHYPGYVINCSNLMKPALEIKAIIQNQSLVATRRIGLIGYITQQEIFDYKFSLPHKDVISAMRVSGTQSFDEPDNPNLCEIWQRRRPQYFLEDTKTVKAIIERQNASLERFQLHGISYYHVKSFKIGETESWMLYSSVSR